MPVTTRRAKANEFNADPMSLTSYLCQAYLPPLILSEALPQIDQFANPWPHIEELNLDGYQRLIRIVSEIPLPALQNAIRIYYQGVGNRLKVHWENTRLTLPCPGVTVLGPTAMARLLVENEDDFQAALEHLILGTTAEALRTVEHRQFDEDELKFNKINVSSARNARPLWTVYVFGPQVPPTSILRPGVVILAIPPWMLGVGDLREFSSRRVFDQGDLDREPPGTTAWSNATKLWAMLYDSCRVSGYRWFVITTYQQWVFGTWSEDWSGAEVTEPVPFDRTRGMTIVEMLTFWIECAREKTIFWQIAADAPYAD